MEYAREQIEEIYKTLPYEVREYIVAVSTADKFMGIVNGRGLNKDQIASAASETNLAMMGEIDWENYTNRLKKKLNISGQQAESMLVAINNELFIPLTKIIDDLMNKKEIQPVTEVKTEVGSEIVDDPKLMPTIISDKLSGTVRMPQVKVSAPPPNLPTGEPGQAMQAGETNKPSYNGSDPYREAAQ